MLFCLYNVACTTCGQFLLENPVGSGLEAIKIAYSRGWVADEGTGYLCAECPHPEHPRGLSIDVSNPANMVPDKICSCGKKATGRNKICKACGKSLKLRKQGIISQVL